MDKELLLLDEIGRKAGVSQRELAEKSGVSLGNVNLLLKKMVKEGLVKMESIPANRVLYMLTPKGMAEKADKTYRYIRAHYHYIESLKKRIKEVLLMLLDTHEEIQLYIENDEVSALLALAADELHHPSLRKVSPKESLVIDKKTLLVCSNPETVLFLTEEGFSSVSIVGLL